MPTYISDDKLASLADPDTLGYAASCVGELALEALAKHVNLTKVFATIDRTKVVESADPIERQKNNVYLYEWTHSPEYIEALREVLNKACRKAHGFSTHTIYIDGTLIGETEGYDDSELTRSYLCEQIQELVRLSIKYSGLA